MTHFFFLYCYQICTYYDLMDNKKEAHICHVCHNEIYSQFLKKDTKYNNPYFGGVENRRSLAKMQHPFLQSLIH